MVHTCQYAFANGSERSGFSIASNNHRLIGSATLIENIDLLDICRFQGLTL
jgi:hypothetical protein